MSIELAGHLRAEGLRFDLVLARFNDFYGERLLAGSLDCLKRHGVAEDAIRIVRVPGSFELPQVAGKLAASGSADAVVVLGVLIRGETPHFDHIASVVSRGVSQAGIESGRPVVFGVLTCDSPDQAANRSGAKNGNKGWEAALAAIEMANLYSEIAGGGSGVG